MENKKYYKYNDIDFEVNLTLDKVLKLPMIILEKMILTGRLFLIIHIMI